MRWIIVVACLLGCRSTKYTTKASEEINSNMELSRVALTAGVKERNVLTYWPDGSMYRFEQLREQMEEGELARALVEEKQTVKQSQVKKEREPAKVWLYMGIGLALMAAAWVFRKLS